MILSRACILSLVLVASCFAQADTPDVHDPAIIREGEFYYIFSTGPGIPMRRSRDLFKWERIGTVFARMLPWTQADIPTARDYWAPDISFFGGKYHLYYSVSTFGKNRSVIGHATNETLAAHDPRYNWVDHGKVIESKSENDWNAIDPNVAFDEQGKPWLAFGSFWSGIKLVRLDETTGQRIGDEMHSVAARPKEAAIEAPFIIRRGDWFYLFVSFDQCCNGAASTYKTMVGRSRSFIGPYLDATNKPMLEGGATLFIEGQGRYRGPGHNAVLVEGDKTWLVHHFYDADDRGRRKLQIRPLTSTADGWPKAGEPLAQPIR